MQSLPSHRNYGLVIVVAILCSLFWVMLDNQRLSSHPGMFASLRRHVWCHTILQVADGEAGRLIILNHYPGKKLKRVMEDFGFPEQAVTGWLNAEKDTFCFPNWREAALADIRFRQMIEGYKPVIAKWSEAAFKEAILTLTFQPNGEEKLRASLYRQAEQQKGE